MDTDKLQSFKANIQTKIDKILAEFAEGKLNREQFHALYERYNSQMELAEKAEDTATIGNDGGTIMIRQKFMGKAQGMIIFANDSGNVIETLGTFGLAMTEVVTVLDDFTQEWKAKRTVDRAVRAVSGGQWLLFVGGAYTTSVTLFKNEPSGYQTKVIQRMHGEFEAANKQLFKTGKAQAASLVFPFQSFVVRNLETPTS